MIKSRLIIILFIVSLWLSMTGFAPLSQGDFSVVQPAPQAQPGTFAKTGPSDKALDSFTSQMPLVWAPAAGATSYQYCIDTTNDNQCTNWTSSGIKYDSSQGYYVLLNSLVVNTTYYWQVRASDGTGVYRYADNSGDGTTPFWSFTTLPTENYPDNFNKTYPTDAATEVEFNPVLTWDATDIEDDPTGITYDYCVDTSNNNQCNAAAGWVTGLTDASAALSGLIANQTYSWQVRAHHANGDTYANGVNGWFTFTARKAPDPFNKDASFTADAAVNVSRTPTLGWTTANGSTGYQYCVNTEPSCPTNGWVSTGVSTSVTLPTNLDYNQTYYWQARSMNATGDGFEAAEGWWSFTTLMEPFNKTGPNSGSIVVPVRPTLQWGASSHASYEYCVNTQADCASNGAEWVSVGTETSVTLPTDLQYNQKYFWQVRAYNPATELNIEANSGTWWSFTTAMQPFAKLTPTDAAVQVSRTPLLSWEPSVRASEYLYCINTSPTCPANGWLSVGTSTSVTLGTALDYNQTYYWQVQAVDKSGSVVVDSIQADGKVWHSFTTVMQPFGKSAPVDAQSFVSVTPTLQWIASVRASGYEYCVNTAANCTANGAAWKPVTTNSVTLATALDYNQTYYWQVRAMDQVGSKTVDSMDADGGTWWSFVTMMQPFTKTAPADGAVDVSRTPTLSWNPSARATYEYCMGTENGTCPGNTWTAVSGTSVSLPANLDYTQTYYWQVRAVVKQNGTIIRSTDADGGAWHRFTTVMQPFHKTLPINGADRMPVKPSLSWESSLRATGYAYCVNTAANCPQNGWTTVSGTSVNLPSDLNWDTTYYWQIRALNGDQQYIDADGANGWFSFHTLIEPPAAFSKVSPANVLTPHQPTAATLTWEASARAVKYQYCISESQTCPDKGWKETTATSASVSLENEKIYYWHVTATNGDDMTTESNDGAWWSFKTVMPAPTAFNKQTPENPSVNLPVRPTLTWTASQHVEYYQYCVNTAESCTADQWVKVNTNDPVTLSSDLAWNTTYYWQVQAVNSDHSPLSADDGAWFKFSTQMEPAGAFEKIGPADGAEKQNPFLTFSWKTSSKAVRYEYCFSDTKGVCPGDNWTDAGTNTSIPLTGLNYGAVYYWQVRAVNGTGQTTEANGGNWWSFTTHNRSHWYFLSTVIK